MYEVIKEEIIILDNIDVVNLAHIFECGQCFRWNKDPDNSYTGVVGQKVLNVRKISENSIEVKIYQEKIENKEELLEFCVNYFDLNRNYKKIKKELSKIDKHIEKSIKMGEGIRILNQDLWETIISFIISANNNIPRIKKIIEAISKKYGNKIIADKKEFYTFPTPEQLGKATIEDLRKMGLGFRDKRVYETTKMILNKEVDLEKLPEQSTNEIRENLQKLSGVGQKVADCIMLFSTLDRIEVFPVDVWIRRVMNTLYIHNPEEEKVNKDEVVKLAQQKFGDIAGIAQQYLYYFIIQ